jgi:hypothetical protein
MSILTSRDGSAQGVVAIAGSAVVRRVIDHGSAHGVEFYVAPAGEQINLGLDEGGPVTVVPQSASAAVGGVDVLNVAPPERDDEPGNGFCAF